MKKEYKIGLAILVLVGLYFGYLAIKVGPIEVGQATAGLPATYATSTDYAVTTAVLTLTATSSNCTSRVITTKDNSIDLSFSDIKGDKLTNFEGIRQNASTTKEYDSGLYGCGRIRVRGDGASTIHFTEFN